VGALIPGFTEALTYMHPGDRFLVHIPSALAYGERGAGESIPPNADLMFQIIMLEVFPTEED
jgi:peptidylprolyl isomerase